MGTPSITTKTTLIELAALVSEALEAAGIVATLSGGSAVSAYTENRYESEDLDFVTTALLEDLKPVLEPRQILPTELPRIMVLATVVDDVSARNDSASNLNVNLLLVD